MYMTDLTKDGVSILEQINGVNFRYAYSNSARGRDELSAECPPELVAEVLAVWGDEPTVPEIPPPAEPAPTPQPDPRDLAITQLMREVAALKAKEAERIG